MNDHDALRQSRDPEEYERFAREVLIPRYEALKADPSLGITMEQLRASMAEWDREDGIVPSVGSEVLKRSA